MTMSITDLIRMKKKHLDSLLVHLEGYDPHRTEKDVIKVKATARMLSVDLVDILEYARDNQLITNDKYHELFAQVQELRRSIDKV